MNTEIPAPLPERNEKALTAVEKARDIVISTAHDYGMADEFCMNLKMLEKEVDAIFDDHISAAFAAHKSLVAKKKKYSEPIEEARRHIKSKMSAWLQSEEEIRRREESRLQEEFRKESEENQLRAAEEAEKRGDNGEANAIISEPVYAPPIVLATSVPKSKTVIRMIWKFRINNEFAIPRAFLMPDEKKIGGVVRSMGKATNIPGIAVFQVTA